MRCRLCDGETMLLRGGLCGTCFDGSVRASELYDELALKAAPAKGAGAGSPAWTGVSATHLSGRRNGGRDHAARTAPARAVRSRAAMDARKRSH
jgi:hypothetical protein